MLIHLKRLKKFTFLAPIVVLSVFFYFISPQELVEYVGVSNAYLFMFLVAFLGGVTIFSGVPYPAILVAFSLGGLNPYLLGIAAAAGLFLGDSTSFFVGRKGEEILHGHLKDLLDKMLFLYEKYPKYIPYIFFLYGAFAPFPNDVVTLTAGLKGYSYVKTMSSLALGNLVFCITVAYAADFFSTIF